MSNSALVSYTKISPNKTSPRNHAIDTITIHCVVGQCSVETLGNVFAPTERQASSNYGVGVDGRIGMYCEEKDRSWCSSSGLNDNRAITIEVASDTVHPYAVNDKAYAALLDLVTDICKRNRIKKLLWKADKSLIGQVDKQNMTVHRWFANNACPGDYLYKRHGEIAAEVNKRMGAAQDEEADEAAAKWIADMATLCMGFDGTQVDVLRALLLQRGYGVSPSGVWEESFDAVVRQYQHDNGLVADGIVGNQTWAALFGAG